jgi:hypothetical protein
MMKLELDWASDDLPAARMYECGWDDDAVIVEYDESPGPAGWPTVRVYVTTREGEMAHVAGMRLYAWLRDVYGMGEDEASEIADLAKMV